VNNQRTTTIEERNRKVNELNAERIQYIEIMNNILQVGEEAIRNRLGDDGFTWQEFAKNPQKYAQPLPVAEPVPQGDGSVPPPH
jgi:hypothetical protein